MGQSSFTFLPAVENSLLHVLPGHTQITSVFLCHAHCEQKDWRWKNKLRRQAGWSNFSCLCHSLILLQNTSLLPYGLHTPACRCYSYPITALMQNPVNISGFVSGLDCCFSTSWLICFGAAFLHVRERILYVQYECGCKILQIDEPPQQLRTTVWILLQPISGSFTYVFTLPPPTMSPPHPILFPSPAQLRPFSPCSSQPPRYKNKWINKNGALSPSSHHNDDSLFSKFHHIPCQTTFIPAGCRERCTPPRGQKLSPAVEVIKTLL